MQLGKGGPRERIRRLRTTRTKGCERIVRNPVEESSLDLQLYYYAGTIILMSTTFNLHPDDPLPLYAQLEREIRVAITMGTLRIGDRLPTVRQMAVDLRINANTVAKVYAELEREGLLSTRRGIGTFVQSLPKAQPPGSPDERKEDLRSLAERFVSEATMKGYSWRELLEEIQQIHLPPKEKSHAQ
jgi:GntR family transcriptional regulator